ncbi:MULTISPECIES: trypco2 family protein [Streptomyces]|uniref:Trypco2 family protein n=1 Tax=Streptomyces doebereineriae TaxID=3075528 RepID=A0ABU2VGL9_9ACTN|nr:trypco2 family protein [Streptomyces sp. DSM 41640]MDT0484725.1 trypco2 family protein [Streptomyces sp. DSM 41640]
MTDSHCSDPGWLDLADAIAMLRDQIAEAQSRTTSPSGPGDRGVLFTVGEITLELGLELTGVQGIDGGLRWSVVSLGGKKESGRRATHTVTVKLQPHQPGSGDINVRDTE